MFLMTQKIDFYYIYKKNKNNVFFREILGLISFFYKIIHNFRLSLYKSKLLKSIKLPIKVISIGNITTGGTGKTPLTIDLANSLVKHGYKVAILSRGYKRLNKNNENILVSDGTDILADYETCGDEPYLVAKKTKSIVLSGANRLKSAYSAINLKANIIILDDGYQHLKIARDENILILDANKPFDNGCLLPKGLLREELSAIKRATMIVFSNSTSNVHPEYLKVIENLCPGIPMLHMSYKIKCLRGINIKKSIDLNTASKSKYLTFCGIGNPESFTNSLKSHGLDIVENIEFPDHHNYEYEDIKRVIEIAEKNNIQDIITTEKDAIKLEELTMSAPVTFWYSEIEVRWKDANSLETLARSTTPPNDVIAS